MCAECICERRCDRWLVLVGKKRKRIREKRRKEEEKVEKNIEDIRVDEEPEKGVQCRINRKHVRTGR